MNAAGQRVSPVLLLVDADAGQAGRRAPGMTTRLFLVEIVVHDLEPAVHVDEASTPILVVRRQPSGLDLFERFPFRNGFAHDRHRFGQHAVEFLQVFPSRQRAMTWNNFGVGWNFLQHRFNILDVAGYIAATAKVDERKRRVDKLVAGMDNA